MIRDSLIYPKDMRIKLNISTAGDTEEPGMKAEGREPEWMEALLSPEAAS